jgi:hypothetical protein
MWLIGVLASLALIVLALLDGFEAMVQTRRVTHRFRFARLYYRSTWGLWRALALKIASGKRRESLLSLFGPVSLFGLLVTWVAGLISGFALLQWSLGTPLQAAGGPATLTMYFYMSGTTFFTLGYGDVTPLAPLGRILSVIESGLGFGFLAVVISYLPVLSQAYSHREVTISLLDARAGSPPSAAQILLRLARSCNVTAVDALLAEWERWAAEVLESHLSFPLLAFYRSQHDNQSWLAALTAILDTSALLIGGVSGCSYQAQLTFAMARHAAVDLALVLKTPPRPPEDDRLPSDDLQRLRSMLREADLELRDGAAVAEKLTELRGLYEPFVNALARHFLFTLPTIVPQEAVTDNWQRSAWMPRSPGIGELPTVVRNEGHFR